MLSPTGPARPRSGGSLTSMCVAACACASATSR